MQSALSIEYQEYIEKLREYFAAIEDSQVLPKLRPIDRKTMM